MNTLGCSADPVAMPPRQGWIFYDGECPGCTKWAHRAAWMLNPQDWAVAPLQDPWVANRLNLAGKALAAEMRVLLEDGTVYGGGDALLVLFRHVWWLKSLGFLGGWPPIRQALRHGYRWVADHRRCGSGTCATGGRV